MRPIAIKSVFNAAPLRGLTVAIAKCAACRPAYRAVPLLAILVLSVAGCARYRFGAASLYPPDIQTVYVPVFESNSFRRGLSEWLTEAVCKEIEAKTPYKVVGTPQADSVLTAKLVSDTKRVIIE